MIDNILKRIYDLTQIDIHNKTTYELLACPCEEFGELTRELKIAYRTHGNTYKIADEGIEGESVDVFIGAVCMYFATLQDQPETNLINSAKSVLIFKDIYKNDDVWAVFNRARIDLAYCTGVHALGLAQDAISLFFKANVSNDINLFTEIANHKLDKWEKHI